MRVGTHSAAAEWGELFEFRNQPAIPVEQLFRLQRFHPVLEYAQLFRVLLDVRQWDLVGTPKTLEPVASYLQGRAPTFWRPQHNHGPARPLWNARGSAFLLVLSDFANAVFNRGRHGLVHALGIGALHEVRRPAVSRQQAFQLLVRNARKQSGVINLVSIQVQDGENRAIPNGVEKLVNVPGSRQWPGFGLSVPDRRSHDQIRVVEGSAAGVREYISQFTAFVDRTGSFGGAMASDAAGKRELLEELAETFFVLTFFRVDLGVGSFEISGAQYTRRAMAWPGHENHVQVVFLDEPVQVNVDECKAWTRSPVPE